MKIMPFHKTLALAAICAMALHAHAGEIEGAERGGTVWNAGLDGVVIEFDEKGEFNRIYSKYTQPVSVPNTRGIRTAKTIAEEKAKGAIIRFLEQEVTSSTFVAEVSADIERSTARSGIDGQVSLSSEASSNILSSLTELNGSASRGSLRGVIRLEEGYDAATGEAWVKVGLSNRTMGMANSVRAAIANDNRDPNEATTDRGSEARGNPRSHVRKTAQEDW